MRLAVGFLTAITCGSVRTRESKDATYETALPAHRLAWALPGPVPPQAYHKLGMGVCFNAAGDMPDGKFQDVNGTAITGTESCMASCTAQSSCTGFFIVLSDGGCYVHTFDIRKSSNESTEECWKKGPPPTPAPAPTPATIHGDPHVVNIQGDHFDIRRPGLHDLIVVPAGLGDKVRLLGMVTPLGGDRCSKRLYFTEIHVSGSFLEPMHNLELSTSGHHFDHPDAVGLRVDGSANMSIPEFIKKVPAHIIQVAKLHPGMVNTPHGHADTLIAHMSLGPVKLKIGWAHTWSPLFNWMWLEITDGLSEREVGGLMGTDEFTWASSRPEGCP